jgi:hypothetical protein
VAAQQLRGDLEETGVYSPTSPKEVTTGGPRRLRFGLAMVEESNGI